MATYWEIAAHLAYNMFSQYQYLFVYLVFSHLGFWSEIFFLISPFPDLCLLVPLYKNTQYFQIGDFRFEKNNNNTILSFM